MSVQFLYKKGRNCYYVIFFFLLQQKNRDQLYFNDLHWGRELSTIFLSLFF